MKKTGGLKSRDTLPLKTNLLLIVPAGSVRRITAVRFGARLGGGGGVRGGGGGFFGGSSNRKAENSAVSTVRKFNY